MSEYIDYHMGDYLGEYILDIRDDDSGLIKEKIVRCKDCEFGAYNGEACMRIDEWDESLWFPVEPDGFCKWGEPIRNHLEPSGTYIG